MQRVVLLCSYAFVAKKGRPTNFPKLEFDKIAQKTFDSHGTGVKSFILSSEIIISLYTLHTFNS